MLNLQIKEGNFSERLNAVRMLANYLGSFSSYNEPFALKVKPFSLYNIANNKF